MSYWGYKFEQLCTAAPSARSQPVDAGAEYCALYRCRLGRLRMLVSAEIDCRDGSGNYVELKTSKLVDSQRAGHWAAECVLGPRLVRQANTCPLNRCENTCSCCQESAPHVLTGCAFLSCELILEHKTGTQARHSFQKFKLMKYWIQVCVP